MGNGRAALPGTARIITNHESTTNVNTQTQTQTRTLVLPPATTVGEQILGTLRELGPMNADMLAVLITDGDVRAVAEEMAHNNELTLIQYMKPDGVSIGSLYLHPACLFRVANFR